MTSRNRSSKKSRPRRRPSAPSPLSLALSSGDAREVIEPILGDVLATAAKVGEQDDPLEAEMFSAGLRASVCGTWRLLMNDGDHVLGVALVRAAEDAGGVGSLALLRAVEATWPEPVASRARSGANRLERQGVPVPAWAGTLRGIAVESVRMAEDPHGDHALLVATWSYRGERRHSTVALVDRNMGGMVKDALVVEEAELSSFLEDRLPEVADLTFSPVDPARAAAILATGLEVRRAARSGIFPMPESDVDQRASLSLLDARLRWFPRPASGAGARPLGPRACARLAADFLATVARDDPGVQPEHVEFVVRQLLDFKVRYGDGDPLRWSPAVVWAFMGEWFPRKATADDGSIDCLPEVVRRWVRWAGHRRGVASGLVDETVAAVDDSEPAFREACRDRSRFMPAKAVAAAMQDDGVDPADPAAVDAWFQAFRRRSPEERRARLGQDLDVADVHVEHDRLIVAVARPASEFAKDRHLLGV